MPSRSASCSASQSDELRTVLVRRASLPHRGRWAVPGGFVRLDESLDAAAARVLAEKAGLRDVFHADAVIISRG